MNIAVLGTGAVGSLFACRLAQNPDQPILCIVSRESHAQQIHEEGITITEPSGETLTASGENLRACVDTDQEAPADLVLITVKSCTTREALHQHPSLFGHHTIALTLQNGYGNHIDLQTVLPAANILMGTTAQAVNIRPDGTILHAADGITKIGALTKGSGAASDAAEEIRSLLQCAGFETLLSEDIHRAVLEKLLINIAINPLCALHDVPNKYIILNREMETEAKLLVREAISILDMDGFHFEFDDIWPVIASVAEKTGDNICSMLQDVRSGRETEIRKINGAIVEMARRHHSEAIRNAAVVEKIEQLR